jgi:hypothetical protein
MGTSGRSEVPIAFIKFEVGLEVNIIYRRCALQIFKRIIFTYIFLTILEDLLFARLP